MVHCKTCKKDLVKGNSIVIAGKWPGGFVGSMFEATTALYGSKVRPPALDGAAFYHADCFKKKR